MLDLEAMIPFPIFAILVWPIGLCGTVATSLLVFGILIFLGQFPLVIRTLDNNLPGQRFSYFWVNQLFLVATIGLIVAAQHFLFSQFGEPALGEVLNRAQ